MKPTPHTTFGRRFHANPIEREAESCIARCMAKLLLREIPLPIPIESWIEGPLGIRFGVDDLSHLGSDVLGAAFIQDREMLISERLLSQDARFRFTCAHELGHFILHGKLAVAFRDTTAEPIEREDFHEREADRFAAAFLMPAASFVKVLTGLCAEHGHDPNQMRASVLEAGGAFDFLRRTAVPAVTQRFNVSMTAAIFRIREILTPEVGPFMTAVQPPWLLSGHTSR